MTLTLPQKKNDSLHRLRVDFSYRIEPFISVSSKKVCPPPQKKTTNQTTKQQNKQKMLPQAQTYSDMEQYQHGLCILLT